MGTTDPFLAAADIFDPPVDPYAGNPVGFANDRLGFYAWSKQREIMESVRDHERTAVRACHGPGKTATAAQLVLAFLAEYPGNSRVVTTAPTWTQVADLLWREIRAAVGHAHAKQQLTAWPVPNATKLDLGEQWFAIGHSTDRPERFQGHHADHLLLVVDEASGVHELIFEAAEGFLTAEGSRVLLLGNPTQTGGAFHRAFTTERALWNCIHISAYDCPNETGEIVPAHVARALPRKGWAEERRKAWGEESWIYQVRVLGNFAKNTKDAVFNLGEVEEAQRRELPADSTRERVVISCDVARFGDDETVIAERVGNRVRIREHYIGQRPPTATASGSQTGDLVETAGRVIEYAREHPIAHVRLVIDDTGVGGGVTDILRNAGWNVTAFNGGEQAFRPDLFPNRRSELWFEGAAQVEDLDLDPDDQLAADLTAPKRTHDLKQRRVVERKEETKKRLGRSPDRGDAVLLTLVPAQSLGAVAPAPTSRQEVMSDDDLLTQPM
jgi:phage terminase large subunit